MTGRTLRRLAAPALALAALAAAAPAGAEGEIVGPEAFEALAEGRTLHFSLDGAPFGAERFLPGRRSLWRFHGGECAEGVWQGRGEEICFVYPPAEAPICWRFRREDGGYAAHLVEESAETGFVLRLEAMDDAPLACPGPDVGS